MEHNGQQHAAELIRAGAPAYAAQAAELLLDEHPEVARAFGASAFRKWKAHLQEHLQELAAAIEINCVDLFRLNLLWTTRAFVRRDVPASYVQTATAALETALRESLPNTARETVTRFIRAAADAVDADAAGADAGLAPIALRYAEAALSGRTREAIELVVSEAQRSADVADVYERILLPVEAHVGQMWHDGELAVWEEHVVSETTRSAMSIIAHLAPRAESRDCRVLIGSVGGDTHALGLRATADLLDLAGYDVVNLGTSLPDEEWVAAIGSLNPDAVVVSVALRTGIARLPRLADHLRSAASNDHLRIIAGGPALTGVDVTPDLLQVDAVVKSPSEAIDAMRLS